MFYVYVCLGVLNSKTSSDYEGGDDVRNVQHSFALIKAKDLRDNTLSEESYKNYSRYPNRGQL